MELNDSEEDIGTVDRYMDQYPPDDGTEDMEFEHVNAGQRRHGPQVSGQGTPVPRSKAVRGSVLMTKRSKMTKTKGLGKVKKSQTRLLAREKQRKALELRKAGASYHQIAEAVGYSDQSGARKAVVRAYDQIIQEPVAELKTIQIERLNHMLMTLWPKVQQGNEQAISTSLRVMDKMDALMGTEAVREVDVNVNQSGAIMVIDGNKDDFISGLKKMVGMGIQPDGTNHQAITQGPTGPVFPPGMGPVHAGQETDTTEDDIIDAVVIEDDPVHKEMAKEKKKTFAFGVEPTVKGKK